MDTTRLAHAVVWHAVRSSAHSWPPPSSPPPWLWLGLAETPAIVIGWLAFFVLGTVAARDRKD
jgi:hypothetical protein